MKNFIKSLCFGGALLVLAGCKAPNAVVFGTGTSFGLDANVLEGGQQQVHLGYHRFEGVTMPHRIQDKNGNTLKQVPLKAYTVASMFELKTGSFWLPSLAQKDGEPSSALTIHQVFATGKAAVIAVGKGDPGNNVAKTSGTNGGKPALLKDFELLQK